MNREALIRAVWAELKPNLPPRNPGECVVRCYLLPKGPEREQCLQDCEAQAAVAALAAKLNTELFKSFADVIWQRGDIDPRPLEKEVRAAFARGDAADK